MRLGCGYPMGPLALLDLIGLDTAYEILDTMYRQGRNRLHAPSPDPQADGHRRPARPQDRPRLLHLRGAGQPRRRRRRRDRRRRLRPPQLTREVARVGVVGSGTMATGIVEVFAKAGYDVIYVTRSPEKVDSVREGVTRSLEKAVQRGKLTDEERDAALGTLTGSTDLEELAHGRPRGRGDRRGPRGQEGAVREPRRDLPRRRDPRDHDVVLAGDRAGHRSPSGPRDVVGMHFFNPAQVMKLVEVVSTVATAADVAETVRALCLAIGKHPVSCGDRAGFIVNALLFPYLNDAVRMLEAHYADADEIDTAMKEGCALPMGPFELLDVVGNDVSLAIQRTLFLEFREPGFAPAPLLEHLVTAGYLGRKTGRGFRDYTRAD